MDNINNELHSRHLIDDKQYQFLEAIRTNKIVSFYYELRLLLYLGIMLFTGGVGYFAYQNMGDIGHLASMALIAASIIVGFYFIKKYAKPYSNLQVTVNHVYFDYILILVSLLIISLFVYIQVYFNLVEVLLTWSSYISAAILIFMAYRYDNRALLSMGITAIAAAVGISITPIDWAQGDWFTGSNLYVTSMVLGALLYAVGLVTYRMEIKQHFKFSYQNFGLMLYYIGCIAAMFDSESEVFYAFITLASAAVLTYYTWKNKEFLFFLYSSIVGYIAITYLLFLMLDNINGGYVLFVYYFPLTCIGYIVFLVKKKSHFAND
jgi:hypothetical protein